MAERVESAKELLDQWVEEGLVAPSARQTLQESVIAYHEENENELPLGLKVVAGIGAVISSLCFVGFLSAAKIINFESEAGLCLWGLIFMVSAIALYHTSAGRTRSVVGNFLVQSSFCVMAVGKILVVIGLAGILKWDNSGWGITMALLLVSAASYAPYPLSLERFLSAWCLMISILLNIVLKAPFDSSAPALNVFVLAQIIAGGMLFTMRKRGYGLGTLAYATVTALFVSILYLSAAPFSVYTGSAVSLMLVNGILAASLIVLGWTAGSSRRLGTEPLMVAAASAVLLGVVSAPGILLSMCCMLLGYGKHEKPLLVLGVLLMPVFLFLFYYNLEVSLLAKSGILVGSGLTLLAGRLYMFLRKFDREEVR